MTTFGGKLRYRIGKRLSRLAEPLIELEALDTPVTTLSTNPVEYAFPASANSWVSLLTGEALAHAESAFAQLQAAVVRESDALFGLGSDGVSTAAGDGRPTISENLFAPLGKRVVDGKSFSTPRPDEQATLLSDFIPGTARGNRIGGYRKSFDETRIGKTQVLRRGPDIWDLILPLLQPPLDSRFVDILELPPRCAPYPYQWEGIKFLVEREAALLGDDMGTGKTVQSILAGRLLFQRGEVRKALIVAPLSVLAQWDREVGRWAPSLRTTVVRGTVEHRRACWSMPAHVWITTYDTLRQDVGANDTLQTGAFDLAILDEAQRIKNRSTGVSQAVRQLKCKYRWALSGTPIENRISELGSIFAFLKPGLFPGHDVAPEEARALITPYFLRRRKEDVLKDLPAKEEFPVWLRLGDEQQETYDRMERERVVALHGHGREITAHNIVTLIGELKKICNRDPVTGVSAKIDWLRENIDDMCGASNKVLVFSQYVQEQFGGTEYLAKMLEDYGPVSYGAATTDRNKERLVESFQRDAGKRVFLGNPRTAGVGLNQLVAANYVVHFDHWWNPAVTNQATARAHRPNQTKCVFVYHLWIEDTIEELVLKKTLSKQKLYDEVIDSLSVEASAEVLLEIYDDLLVKHGLKAIGPQATEREVARPETRRSPREFEEQVGRLFTAMGYASRVTSYSRDGGVDIVATREMGASVEKVAIQCKQQAAPVGRPALQQLLGVLAADPTYSRGVLVAVGEVSRDALDLVRENGRLQVINGNDLRALFLRFKVMG